MDATDSFEIQLNKLRAGEPDTLRKFVASYEPFIRRSLRNRARARSSPTVFSDSDICQSALASFLIRVAAGEYEIGSRSDLEKLLLTIVRHKTATMMRYELADRRDLRRRTQAGSRELTIESADGPSAQAERLDLLSEVRIRLRPDERTLFDSRRSGATWDTIAEEHHESSVVLRQRLSRAIRRVAIELGVDHEDE